MIQKIKDWTWLILAAIGVIAIIEYFRSKDSDVDIEDISKEIEQKEELIKQLDNIKNLDMSESEIIEWLNKK